MTSAGFQEIFEKCFATLFDDGSEFDDALRYACFGGGKRVRPRGVFLGASAVSATPPLDEVLSLAGAIELIQQETGYRSGDVLDFRADCIGLMTGAVLMLAYAAILKKW